MWFTKWIKDVEKNWFRLLVSRSWKRREYYKNNKENSFQSWLVIKWLMDCHLQSKHHEGTIYSQLAGMLEVYLFLFDFLNISLVPTCNILQWRRGFIYIKANFKIFYLLYNFFIIFGWGFSKLDFLQVYNTMFSSGWVEFCYKLKNSSVGKRSNSIN